MFLLLLGNEPPSSIVWPSHIMDWLFFNSISGRWIPTGSTWHVGHQLAYCTFPGWLWGWRIWWNDDWQGKPKYSVKTCLSATFVHHKSHLTWLGANPGSCSGKPVTNHLSYGMVLWTGLTYIKKNIYIYNMTFVKVQIFMDVMLPLVFTAFC
jgi:hypothetical protein